MERTEKATQQLLKIADSITLGKVEISSAFVGVQPSSYPVNLIHLWTSGPHESVSKIKFGAKTGILRTYPTKKQLATLAVKEIKL